MGADASFAVGLLMATAVISVVFVPIALIVLGWLFDLTLTIPPARVAGPVAWTVLAPVTTGVVVRRLAPAVAERLAGPVERIGGALMVGGLILVLFRFWLDMVSLIGNGTLAAMVAFCVIGLAVGHLLVGPERGNRAFLALATAARHPGVAVAMAGRTSPISRSCSPRCSCTCWST